MKLGRAAAIRCTSQAAAPLPLRSSGGDGTFALLQLDELRAGGAILPQYPAVNVGITGHALLPRALGIDEFNRVPANARPRAAIGERLQDTPGNAVRRVRRKEIPGLAVANQLPVTANVGGDDNALLRHCLQR